MYAKSTSIEHAIRCKVHDAQRTHCGPLRTVVKMNTKHEQTPYMTSRYAARHELSSNQLRLSLTEFHGFSSLVACGSSLDEEAALLWLEDSLTHPFSFIIFIVSSHDGALGSPVLITQLERTGKGENGGVSYSFL